MFDRSGLAHAVLHPWQNVERREALVAERAESTTDDRNRLLHRKIRGRTMVMSAHLLAAFIAAAGVGHMVVQTLKGERAPQHRDHASSPVERIVNRSLSLGSYTFVFDASLADAEVQSISHAFLESFPRVAQYISSVESESRTITVSRQMIASAERGRSNYREATIRLDLDDPGYSDWTEEHELVHTLKGKGKLPASFAEEGSTEAIVALTHPTAAAYHADAQARIQLGPSLRDGALSVPPHISLDATTALGGIRYHYAADLFLQLEKKFPGYIKKLHEAFSTHVTPGQEQQIWQWDDLRQLMLSVEPGAQEILDTHPTTTGLQDKSSTDHDVLCSFFENRPSEGGILSVVIAHHDAMSGGKRAYAHQTVDVTTRNPRTNRSITGTFQIDDSGVAEIAVCNRTVREAIGDNDIFEVAIAAPDFALTERWNVDVSACLR